MCTHLPAHKHVHSGAPGGVGNGPPTSSEAGSIRTGEMGQPYGRHKASKEGEDHEAAEAPSFSAGTLSLVLPSSSAVPVPSRSSSGPGCPSPLLMALPW